MDKQRERHRKRQEEDERAAEIDQRPCARLCRLIENVDAHMSADLQRPSRRQQNSVAWA